MNRDFPLALTPTPSPLSQPRQSLAGDTLGQVETGASLSRPMIISLSQYEILVISDRSRIEMFTHIDMSPGICIGLQSASVRQVLHDATRTMLANTGGALEGISPVKTEAVPFSKNW